MLTTRVLPADIFESSVSMTSKKSQLAVNKSCLACGSYTPRRIRLSALSLIWIYTGLWTVLHNTSKRTPHHAKTIGATASPPSTSSLSPAVWPLVSEGSEWPLALKKFWCVWHVRS